MIKAYFITMAIIGAAALTPAIDAFFSDTPSSLRAAQAQARPAASPSSTAVGNADPLPANERNAPPPDANSRKPQHDRFADHFRAGDEIRQVAVSLFRDQ